MGADRSTRRSYPIYLLLDVSGSMREPRNGGPAPQTAFTALIPHLLMALADTPAVAMTASLSIIAFSDQTEVLRPMLPLTEPGSVREPVNGAATDYAAALRFLCAQLTTDREAIEAAHLRSGYLATVAAPLIFMITDGAPWVGGDYQHPSEWRPYRDRLVSAPNHARIAAIGLTGAHPRTLRQVATSNAGGASNAFIALPDADPDSLAAGITSVIGRSVRLSVRTGDMIVDVPHGMRRIDE